MKMKIQVLSHGEGLELPRYQTQGSAGMDLRAAVESSQVINPGVRMAIPTGLKIAIPGGHEAQIRPRSGLAIKKGLTVVNAPGTIDSDYRGEVGVLLINLGHEPVEITRGMRIAQLVIAPVIQVQLESVASLDETQRGAGGFGSTGA
jgi:dUTP pyrophosphatase